MALDALMHMRDVYDPSLAFNHPCREAISGYCSMNIDGAPLPALCRYRHTARRRGPHRCHTIMHCAKACPEGLNPAKASAGIKPEMALSSNKKRSRRH